MSWEGESIGQIYFGQKRTGVGIKVKSVGDKNSVANIVPKIPKNRRLFLLELLQLFFLNLRQDIRHRATKITPTVELYHLLFG